MHFPQERVTGVGGFPLRGGVGKCPSAGVSGMGGFPLAFLCYLQVQLVVRRGEGLVGWPAAL